MGVPAPAPAAGYRLPASGVRNPASGFRRLEGLDAFQVALQLAEEVHALGLKGSIRDQLTRASESVVLNIAEAHPATGADRARGFQIARKEASECRGALAILKVRKQIKPETFDRLWSLVDRISAMLFRLIHPG